MSSGRSIARWALLTLLALCALVATWTSVRTLASPAGRPTTDEAPAVSTVRDDRGRTVATGHRFRRVVSLVPALTEPLLELGVGRRLVARTEHDRSPALRNLPSVGSTTAPSLEVLHSSRPDLVITWADEASPRVVSRLRERGVRTYGARLATFDDLRRHLRNLGALLGVEARADSLLASFDRRMAAASILPPPDDRPTVGFLVWPRPLSVAGPGTFVHEVIRRAGGRNAFGDLDRPWPVIDPELLAARDPDVLLLPTSRSRPSPWRLDGQPWASLTAIHRGRIVRLSADLVERPTLRSPRAVRLLARELRDTALRGEGSR